jgi:hypothetical protein
MMSRVPPDGSDAPPTVVAGRAFAVAAFACGLLASCASEPPSTPAAPAAPLTSPDVYFYPLKAQSAEQQDRDRYECYLWARQRTGFDPSLAWPDQPPVHVVAVPPPGHDTAVGAVTGAAIGAAVSQPWETAEGAAIGAVAGAVLGAASDAARQQQAEQVQAQHDQARSRSNAQMEAAIQSYRRAMQTCLEARGYAVR